METKSEMIKEFLRGHRGIKLRAIERLCGMPGGTLRIKEWDRDISNKYVEKLAKLLKDYGFIDKMSKNGSIGIIEENANATRGEDKYFEDTENCRKGDLDSGITDRYYCINGKIKRNRLIEVYEDINIADGTSVFIYEECFIIKDNTIYRVEDNGGIRTLTRVEVVGTTEVYLV
jgi:hypothetical protein